MTDITKDINYDKVVAIQIARWRRAREDQFKSLDIQSLRALEEKDEQKLQDIISKKEELRNITNYDFSKCSSLQEIFNLWFPILGDQQKYPR